MEGKTTMTLVNYLRRVISFIFVLGVLSSCFPIEEDSVSTVTEGSTSTSSISCDTVCGGLVGYYPFNGDIKDYSGNGNHGIVAHKVTSVADAKGNTNSAYEFNGIDSFISLKGAIDNSSSDYTMVIHVKINQFVFQSSNSCNSNGGSRAGLITNQGKGLQLMYCPNWTIDNTTTKINHYKLWYQDPDLCNSSCVDEYYQALDFNQFYLLAAVKSDNQSNFYIDRRFGSWQNLDFSYPVGNLSVGYWIKNGETDKPFNGVIDEIRIYNRAITFDEFEEIYLKIKY